MIHIRKETLRFMRCQSCLTDKDLNDIKIQYPDSAQYQSITLCDNCIQHLTNLYQKDKHSCVTDTKENGVVWHDLRKNPNDLPKESYTVLDEAGDRFYYFRGRFHYESDSRFDCKPVAWCEIPRFEEVKLDKG